MELMEESQLHAIVTATALCRLAQATYFHVRTQAALRTAKAYEHTLDRLLTIYFRNKDRPRLSIAGPQNLPTIPGLDAPGIPNTAADRTRAIFMH